MTYQNILKGQIERGEVTTFKAVTWLCLHGGLSIQQAEALLK